MEGKTSMIRISFAAAAIAAVAETRGKARGSTATLSFLAADRTRLQDLDAARRFLLAIDPRREG